MLTGDVFDLSFVAATGYVSFGIVIGALVAERMWWLLARAYPRRHRPHPGCCQRGPVLRYLAPGSLWRDTARLAEDFAVRWDAQHPESG